MNSSTAEEKDEVKVSRVILRGGYRGQHSNCTYYRLTVHIHGSVTTSVGVVFRKIPFMIMPIKYMSVHVDPHKSIFL